MSFCWSSGQTWGALNTVQAHAYLLTNLHGPVYLVILIIRCKPTHMLEYIGTVLIIIASVITVLDPTANKVGEDVNN